MSSKYTFGVLNKCLLKYRIHSKQASVSKRLAQQEYAREIIRKNAYEITGEYDEAIFECLWFLSGREKLTKQNYKRFSELVDYTIEKNEQYQHFNTRSMKRILYNRFFEEVIKNRFFISDYKSLRKIIHLYNMIDLLYYYLNKL